MLKPCFTRKFIPSSRNGNDSFLEICIFLLANTTFTAKATDVPTAQQCRGIHRDIATTLFKSAGCIKHGYSTLAAFVHHMHLCYILQDIALLFIALHYITLYHVTSSVHY